MKVRTCHSFTIHTLVDLQLSVISTSEFIVLISQVYFVCQLVSTSAVFILFVSTSTQFILFVSTRAVRTCQAPEKFCGKAKWKSDQTFATGSPVKISMRSRFARTQIKRALQSILYLLLSLHLDFLKSSTFD